MSRLGLGTVQFGVDYGMAVPGRRVPRDEVREILREAAQAGVDTLDTAAAYGHSEAALGAAMVGLPAFRVVTKTLPLGEGRFGAAEASQLEQTFAHSLQLLGLGSVYGLLVHDAEQLLQPGGERLFAMLQAWRDDGRVQRIGVSVYDAQQLDAICSRFSLDLVQLPLNVLDQRLLIDGSIDRLVQAGVEIHARSLFLQGVLLQSPEQLPAYLAGLAPALQKLRIASAREGVSVASLALGFARHLQAIDTALVGVHGVAQWRELLQAWSVAPALDFSGFAVDAPELLDPRCWLTA